MKFDNLFGFFILFAVLTYFFGIDFALKLFLIMLKSMNDVFLQLFGSSILSELFSYVISFSIVGIILNLIGSPRGKEGHIIGKVLYFCVSYIVVLILDKVSLIIFN